MYPKSIYLYVLVVLKTSQLLNGNPCSHRKLVMRQKPPVDTYNHVPLLFVKNRSYIFLFEKLLFIPFAKKNCK